MHVHSPEQRSFKMPRTRIKDACSEMVLRGWLWANEYRYQLHRKHLPRKPDIVLPKYHVVIFVHSCFWRRHGCRLKTTSESRMDSWLAEFSESVCGYKCNIASSIFQSWRVMVIRESSLRGNNVISEPVAAQIAGFLNSEVKSPSFISGLC